MPKITIDISTTEEEQQCVLSALQRLLEPYPEGLQLPVSKIAAEAHMSPTRVRYVIEDLVGNGAVERYVVKAFNEHYVRYGYRLPESL